MSIDALQTTIPAGTWAIDPSHTEVGFTARHLMSKVRGRFEKFEGQIVTGDLSIKGVTKPVTLDVEVLGTESDPWGGTRVGFEGTGSISRKEFGIDFNIPMDGGRLLIGDKIDITVTVEAVLQENTPA